MLVYLGRRLGKHPVSIIRETMQSLHSTTTHGNKLHIPSLALALVLLISLATPTSSCTEKEKGSLLQFLAGLSPQRDGGGLAASWLEITDCCTWEGISCSTDGAVIQISLASRSLEGNISPSLANLTDLQRLNLSRNSLSDVLPLQLMSWSSIRVIDLGGNQLGGKIPDSIGQLETLQVLDLSSNHLTGAIPGSMNRLLSLSAFNVSNNDLQGPVPFGALFDSFGRSSYDGNPKLCGPALDIRCGSASTAPASSTKQRDKKAVFAIAFGVFFGGLALLLLLGRVLVSISRRKRENTDQVSGGEQPWLYVELIRMPNCQSVDIMKATNDFNIDNVIGSGGCGLVYKGELPGGYKLAIKKLHGERCLTEREFAAEIEALSMARHENLVPLWGYCIHGDSNVLVYSFMENGSLDDCLHDRNDGLLDWPMRLKIARGASRGLSYIHHVCKPHIVHRDIKSSNILLDQDFKAYVADFGLARLMLPSETHVSTELAGSIGYIPPEYGQSSVATLRGDVYSFGVVLLELLTGRRPVPLASAQEELVSWVRQMCFRDKQIQALDPTLGGRGYEEQMLKVLQVACKCVDHTPFKRPTIMEVVACLDSIDAHQPTKNP